MLPEEDLNWKIGEVSYLVTYQEKTTTLKINYEKQAISVSEFVTKTSGTYDVTGIVVGPMGSFVAAELLLKDELTMDMVGIYNTAIVGAYNALDLDTSVLNVGDKVIVRITRVITTTEGVNKGKAYGNATNGATFLKYLIIDSSGYDITYDFSNANVTEISTQEDLINFINNSDRFYSYVKLVGVKAVTYSGSYRIFFGDDIKKLDDQKINTSSPYIYNGNSNWYFENGIVDYFDNNTSTSYNNPVTTEYDIYAIFVGGNAYYHCFVILDPTWFVKEA